MLGYQIHFLKNIPFTRQMLFKSLMMLMFKGTMQSYTFLFHFTSVFVL